MPDLSVLTEKLGVSFHSIALLEEALIHSSYINENPHITLRDNERLEFLGDAVLELIVAEKLYQSCDSSDEGELTILRAALVKRDTLAVVAKRLALGEFLFLGKGEEAGGGRRKTVNLACAMEAVIGAIYLDRGWNTTRKVVLKIFEPQLKEVIERGVAIDYKSSLQEIVQARQQVTPTYHVIAETGPDHDKIFTVEVKAADRLLGAGKGKSKKLAELEAARLALERLTFTP